MDTRTLQRLQVDPAEFRRSLMIDADGGAVALRDAIEPYQQADFEALDAAWKRLIGHSVSPTYSRAWLERPRGHSKTSDEAISAIWALFASRRPLRGVAAAADSDQAGLLRDSADALVRLNPWLRKFIEVQRQTILNPHTGSALEIISSDAASSYGLTPHFIIADELTHWRKRDLWDSLLSAAAKKKDCLLLAIMNAGYTDSWQYELREAIREAASWYFHSLAGPQAKWITQDRLDEQQRLLPPKVYARLWLNRWATGGGDALEEADILASLTLAHRLGRAENGYVYIAALDLGLTRDASALVILGRHVGWTERRRRPKQVNRVSTRMKALFDVGVFEPPAHEPEYEFINHEPTGRIKVCDIQIWRPEGRKVEIESVERAIVEAHNIYGLSAVAYDPWQAEYLAERLVKMGLTTDAVMFVPQNLQSMAQSTLEAFGNRQIDAYAEGDLLADLRALRVVERSYGIRLESPRGNRGHGDTATALAIGLHSIKRFAAVRRVSRLDRPLIVYPTLGNDLPADASASAVPIEFSRSQQNEDKQFAQTMVA